jgi:hypothetical protein
VNTSRAPPHGRCVRLRPRVSEAKLTGLIEACNPEKLAADREG